MKNYVQPGVNLELVAPYARSSGQAALIGAIFGVASNDVAQGATTIWVTEGVFDLPKAAEAMSTPGTKLYWDNTNKVLTATASGNTLVAASVAAALLADPTVRVKLCIVA